MHQAADLDQVHAFSRNNRHAVLASRRCGCFSCEAVFYAWEVTDFTENDFSAVCPWCEIDSVLPDQLDGVTLSTELLRSMRTRYFESAAA